MTTRLRVPAGNALNERGGETFSPEQVYASGIRAPVANASDVIVTDSMGRPQSGIREF